MQRTGDQQRAGDPSLALVQRCQRGDRRALETLLALHDHEVLNMAAKLLGNSEDAQDIRQQVYIKVCRSLANFDGRSSFRTWLSRIVINQCRDHLRRVGADRRRAAGWFEHAVTSDGAPVADREVNREQTQQVIDAVGALSEPQREILVLRHFHEMTLTGAAEVLDIPLSTAASRLRSAMEQLRSVLGAGAAGECHEQGAGHAMQ